MVTEDGESSECGNGDVCFETSKDAIWMDDLRLNLGLVWDAQERDAMFVCFSSSRRRVSNLNGMIFLLRGQNSSHTGLCGKV